MTLLLVIGGILVALMTGRHHLRAQQARTAYRDARAKLPGLRKTASTTAIRSFMWTFVLVGGLLLLAYTLMAARA
jgi:hypothetical protein